MTNGSRLNQVHQIAVIGGVASQRASGRTALISTVATRRSLRWPGVTSSVMGRLRIDHGVDFRRPPAARAANRLRFGPAFPPAAERCALAVVLSMAWTSPGSALASASNGRRHNLPIAQL
jgi:hypothetical protein